MATASMTEWQPIETAPKDGTRVLLWNGQEMFVAHWWNPSRSCPAWFFFFGSTSENDGTVPNATHWMPLPEPPA